MTKAGISEVVRTARDYLNIILTQKEARDLILVHDSLERELRQWNDHLDTSGRELLGECIVESIMDGRPIHYAGAWHWPQGNSSPEYVEEFETNFKHYAKAKGLKLGKDWRLNQ